MLNGGKHIDHPKVLYTKTKMVKAEPLDDSKMMINLDGEYGGDAPMTFTNLIQHIEMFGDVDAIPNDAVTAEDEAFEDAEEAFIKEVEGLTDEDINGDGIISKPESEEKN